MLDLSGSARAFIKRTKWDRFLSMALLQVLSWNASVRAALGCLRALARSNERLQGNES
jgi:hypothetical protein